MAGIGCLTVPAITVQDAAAWPLDIESIVRLNGYEEIKAMGKYQDWFNGADYHIGSEQKVEITQITQTESEEVLHKHERVEMYYIVSGKGSVEVNGQCHALSAGSFLCFYIHHFYRFVEIEEPLVMIRVRFYLGLFMFMGFERHEGDVNEQLVYDTIPVQQLTGREQTRVAECFQQLLTEELEQRFCSGNLIVYLTMQLHSLYCRYAFEHRQKQREALDVWQIIVKVLLETGERTSLSDYTTAMQTHEATLNRQIKDACGYTFYQLQLISKISTACSLLHFPDLQLSYISDYLGFTSVQDFYRVFQRITHQTPREFQKRQIFDQKDLYAREKMVAVIQHLHVHIQEDLDLTCTAQVLDMKAHTLQQLIRQRFGCTFHQLVVRLKIMTAKALLAASDVSVTAVASALGYGSLVTFQRQFKEMTGRTPSGYRQSLAKN